LGNPGRAPAGPARHRTVITAIALGCVGGDPTGLVTYVVWTSWGSSRAVATGVSDAGQYEDICTGSYVPAVP
jgi:hypothetical protein